MITTTILLLFCTFAVLLWFTTFGYWGFLSWRCRGAAPPVRFSSEHAPDVTVVVPVLDEARFIRQKLEDLQRTRYPTGRLRILVVDGGSRDGSVEEVARFEADIWPVELMQVKGACGKAHQVNAALSKVETEFVVLTDVDTTLDPTCIRQLVAAAAADPGCAMVGATVAPATALPEERLHWRIVNRLWYMEGEALGAAAVSGVCHVFKRSLLGVPTRVYTFAEDVELSMIATGNGYRVRIHPQALAREHRVPETLGEMVRYRLRRARDYRQLLRDLPVGDKGSRLTRVLMLIRCWQMSVVPWLAVSVLICGILLSLTGYGSAVVITACVFAFSIFLWLRSLVRSPDGLPRVSTVMRWLAVVAYSLMRLPHAEQAAGLRADPAKQAVMEGLAND